MSMGHSVCVRSKQGVKNALSMTIPLGEGIHRRMVYVELEDGAKLEDVTAAVKADPYFANDETHVFQVASVDEVRDMGPRSPPKYSSTWLAPACVNSQVATPWSRYPSSTCFPATVPT